MKAYYTTSGSFRGSCHHQHKTFKAALDCANRDYRTCARISRGSYGDRSVVRVFDDGTRRTVHADEYGEEIVPGRQDEETADVYDPWTLELR